MYWMPSLYWPLCWILRISCLVVASLPNLLYSIQFSSSKTPISHPPVFLIPPSPYHLAYQIHPLNIYHIHLLFCTHCHISAGIYNISCQDNGNLLPVLHHVSNLSCSQLLLNTKCIQSTFCQDIGGQFGHR